MTPPRFTPYDQDVRDRAVALRRDGATVPAISRELGVTRSSIIKWLSQAGCYVSRAPVRGPGRRRTRPARAVEAGERAPAPAPSTEVRVAPLRLCLPSGVVVEAWDGAELGALLAVLAP